MQIQKRFYKKQHEKIDKTIQNPAFNIAGFETSVFLNDYIKLESMQELFNGIVPYVQVKKIRGQHSFNIINENGYLLSDDPLILLDNIPILNPDQIMQLDVSQIKKVDVLYKTYILGSHVLNCVIMISTNTDNFADIKFPESSRFIKYQTLKEPINYSIFNKSNSGSSAKMPDFSTTLYWDPKIKLVTNAQSINFNTSDSKGVYDIIIKGYSPKGHVYYGKKQITID